MLIPGAGWIPDKPDERDRTIDDKTVKPFLTKAGVHRLEKLVLPEKVDLREFFPAVYQQYSTQSCTAQALAGLIAYFQKVSFGNFVQPSRLFIYKTTRNLLEQPYDLGAYPRTTIGSLKLFGAPPEKYWPYDLNNINVEPPAFCYAYADNFRAISYYRLDAVGTSKDELLVRIRANLAARLPTMFGFFMFQSLTTAQTTGRIPFPVSGDTPIGAHCVIAAGYDDSITVTNPIDGSQTTGALLIRNSWGEAWGEKGYGWLPYQYVLNDLASDFWSLIKQEWTDTAVFGLSAAPPKPQPQPPAKETP